jgi:hypothetical protein
MKSILKGGETKALAVIKPLKKVKFCDELDKKNKSEKFLDLNLGKPVEVKSRCVRWTPQKT